MILDIKKALILAKLFLVFFITNVHAEIKFQEIKTPYAEKLFHVSNNFLPIVNIDIAFTNTGFNADPNSKLGLTRIYTDLVNNLNFVANPKKLRDLLERKAINLSFSADRNNFYIHLKFVKTDYKYVAKILNKFFLKQEFEQQFLDISIAELIAVRKQKYKDSNYLSALNFQKEIYTNPIYQRSSYGSPKSINNINLDDIINYQISRFSNENLNISIVGDIDISEIEYFLRNAFNKLPKHLPLKEYKTDFHKRKFIKVNYPEKKQIIIKSAIEAVPVRDKDYYAFLLFDHIIGGSGLNSRLTKTLREEQGLTYSAYSYLSSNLDNNLWVLAFATDKDKYQKAIESIRTKITSLKDNPITEAELKRAKDKINSEAKIYFSSNSRISKALLQALIDDFDPQTINQKVTKINKVTLTQINKIINKIPDFNDFVTIIVGDLQEI